jgi:hypothetical protein
MSVFYRIKTVMLKTGGEIELKMCESYKLNKELCNDSPSITI